MIQVFWKAAVYVSFYDSPLSCSFGGRIRPLDMGWTSYAAACLVARKVGPNAVLIRLPGDPAGPTTQPARLPI